MVLISTSVQSYKKDVHERRLREHTGRCIPDWDHAVGQGIHLVAGVDRTAHRVAHRVVHRIVRIVHLVVRRADCGTGHQGILDR